MEIYDTIALSGGAFRCLAQLGALKCLEERGLLDRVHTLSGSSGGSVVALLSLMHPPEKLMRSCVGGAIDFSPSRTALDRVGFARQHLPAVRRELTAFTGRANPSFRDLRAATRKRLVVTATDALTCQPMLFGLDRSTEHVSVIDAVEASCSLPVLNSPRFIDGRPYLDGVISAYLPLNSAVATTPESSIGISVEAEEPQASNDITARVLSSILAKTNPPAEPWVYHRTVYLSTPSRIMLDRPEPLAMANLFSLGYERMEQFLTERPRDDLP